jgi:hypothetical protein
MRRPCEPRVHWPPRRLSAGRSKAMLHWRKRKLASSERAHGAGDLRCSFCNKSQDDVQKLIAGPTVFICDECVSVCVDIIADDRSGPAPGGEATASVGRALRERLRSDRPLE